MPTNGYLIGSDGRLETRVYQDQVTADTVQYFGHDDRRSSLILAWSAGFPTNAFATVGDRGKGLTVGWYTGTIFFRTRINYFNIDDTGDIIKDGLWFTDNTIGTAGLVGIEVLCLDNCNSVPLFSRMPNYDYKTTQITLAAALTPTQALEARSNRRVLTISSDNPGGGANNGLYIGTRPAIGSNLIVLQQPVFLVMPYRDWGPVISEPIWLYTTKAGTVVTLSEVWAVPN